VIYFTIYHYVITPTFFLPHQGGGNKGNKIIFLEQFTYYRDDSIHFPALCKVFLPERLTLIAVKL